VFKGFLETEEDENAFPVPFNEVWKVLGYFDKQTAKRALYQSFNNKVDFIAMGINAHGNNENIGRSEDGKFVEENIYLSNKCFLNFGMLSQKPVGKHFARKIGDLVYEIKNNDLKHKKHNLIVQNAFWFSGGWETTVWWCLQLKSSMRMEEFSAS
jgi:hypothetical protein